MRKDEVRAERILELQKYYEVQEKREAAGLPIEKMPEPSPEFKAMFERQTDMIEVLRNIANNNGDAGVAFVKRVVA